MIRPILVRLQIGGLKLMGGAARRWRRVVSEVAARLTMLFEREKSGGCDEKDQGSRRQFLRAQPNQMLDDWRAGGSAVEGRANDMIKDT